jgi:hypothetical protein
LALLNLGSGLVDWCREGKRVRQDKIGDGSAGERRAPSATSRFVGKGRYTNSPPQTATTQRQDTEVEVQVGDVTLVLRKDDDTQAGADKYSARSAPAYQAIGEPDMPVETAVPVQSEHPVADLLVDEPIPEWVEWRVEVVSSSAGYYRRETRLPR